VSHIPARAAPPQPVAVDEDYPAQHPPVIDSRLAVALGKNGFSRSICASVSQKGLLILTPSVRELESRRPDGLKPINGC
jgi:hypothetical protein